jgi:hypothetical protein
VEALTSVKTQLPYEYYVLPFCHKGINLKAQDALNLGEVLRGTRIYETPYKFTMDRDATCTVLCRAVYDTQELQAFALMIEAEILKSQRPSTFTVQSLTLKVPLLLLYQNSLTTVKVPLLCLYHYILTLRADI